MRFSKYLKNRLQVPHFSLLYLMKGHCFLHYDLAFFLLRVKLKLAGLTIQFQQ